MLLDLGLKANHVTKATSTPDCIKEIRRERISNASTPVPRNVNHFRKPPYMGSWTVKVGSALWSVMVTARNGIEI